MKSFRKFLVSILSVLTIAVGAIGITACSGVTVQPNDSGGMTITPGTGGETSDIGGGSSTQHSHNWTETVLTEATCEVQGAAILNCDCGEQEIKVIPALGHERIRYFAKAPTCTEVGWETYEVCEREGCDYTTYQELAALGHDNVQYEGKAATCTEFGWNAYTVCNRCYVSTYQKIEATGHTYSNGSCHCGAVEPGHAHIWDEGTTQKEATCLQAGKAVYVCTIENCGESKTEEIPALGHDNKNYDAKEPECENIGWNAYTVCNRCNYSTYYELSATGHSFGSGVITKEATCTAKGVKTYTCFCGDSYTLDIDALGHNWTNWNLSKAAECEAYGEEKRTCQNDNMHEETRLVEKTGHNWGDWTLSKSATCAEEGEEKRICQNNSSHIETRTVAKSDEHESNADGVCTVCKKTVKNRLNAPRFEGIDKFIYTWSAVDGATTYEVLVNNIAVCETADTTLNMEEYFAGEDELAISVRAIPDSTSDYVRSNYLEYVYDIPGETIQNYKGIGDAVNLLTGSHTEFANGTLSIFDEKAFNTLRVIFDANVRSSETTAKYYEGMQSYLQKLSGSVTNKVSGEASIGVKNLAKLTLGYEFEEVNTYETQLYNETTAAFYDMDYVYIDKLAELYGYEAEEKLASMLSAEFLADAKKVGNKQMTAEEFISRYGTHIMTSAYYGASLNVHYELLSSKSTAESMFGNTISAGITEQLSASMKGFDFDSDISVGTTTTASNFTEGNSQNSRIKFKIKARGGSSVGLTNLSDLSASCAAWQDSVANNCVVMDVPNGGLYCVWDFLGSEYESAKNILNQYFISTCDENYYALQNKINGMYKDCYFFDESTGTMTVNLAGLQTYEKADLTNVVFENSGNSWFNSSESGTFTVYPQYNGHDIKKIVFKGAYYDKDKSGQLISTKFNDFNIKFNEYWSDDIVIELQNFGYAAKAGYAGLDFSEVQSENITINVVNEAYIKGGDGASAGANGLAGILATGKNLTITGDGTLNVVGGNGIKGTAAGSDGGDGGVACIVDGVVIDVIGTVNVYGGRGGDGAQGSTGDTGDDLHGGNSKRAGTGGTGCTGGAGGNGGWSILPNGTIVVKNGQLVIYNGSGGTGGQGGKGGTGGHAYYGDFLNAYCGSGGHGGTGGQGGKGGGNPYTDVQDLGSNVVVYNGSSKGGEGGLGGDPGGTNSNCHDGGSQGDKGAEGDPGDYIYE